MIILDDVWELEHVQPFVNVLGPNCHLLITTRNGGLSKILGANNCQLDLKPALYSLVDYLRLLSPG